MAMVEATLIVNAVVIGALLLYWELRERASSQALKERGGHCFWWRIILRLLLPLVAITMIAQLLGFQLLTLSALQSSVVFWLGQMVFWAGVALSILARETLGRHWAHAAEFQVIPGQKLITHGPYAYVRHPIYTAFILLFIGVELLVGSVIIALAVPLYVLLSWQARQEEKLMDKEFKEQYKKYRQHTGLLLPRLWKKR